MINQYETVFILTPVLSDAQVKEAVDKMKKLITDNGGEVVHYEDWGLKKLAYTIKNKSTGFYHMLQFKADTQFIKTMETEFGRDEQYVRHLTFVMGKNELAYSERRLKRLKNKSEQKQEAK